MKKLLMGCLMLMAVAVDASAQCAMCRSTLENNFSNGEPGIAAGINVGILYLLVLPYLAAAIIAVFWYKYTKHGRKELDNRIA